MLSGSLLSYVAALSVATERVTEFFKRIPLISSALSTSGKGEMEDFGVIAVHLVVIIGGMVICHFFLGFPPKVDQNAGSDSSVGLCLGYGHGTDWFSPPGQHRDMDSHRDVDSNK
jgi:hypothetical protein